MSEEQQKKPSPEALKDIESRLEALRRKVSESPAATPVRHTPAIGRMMWLAFNIVSDLLAGVICGLGIGYALDLWLGTRPIFIAVFLVLGCIASIVNVVRFLQRYEERRRERDKDAPNKE